MAPSSGSCRPPALKTYSKRVNQHPEEPPSKKRRVEEPTPVNIPPRVKKTTGGTIQSYFKPLQRSSSPSATRPPYLSSDPLEHISSTIASQLSSDTLEPLSTPPSSPRAKSESTIEYPRRSQKRPKRRLTTRPVLDPIINMSTQGAYHLVSDDGTKSKDHPNAGLSSANGSNNAAKIAGQDEHQGIALSRPEADSNTIQFTKQNLPRATSGSASGIIAQKLLQTQLDVGVPAITVCKECGMQYNTTLKEDQRNHEKYHDHLYCKVNQPMAIAAGVNLMNKYVERQCHDIRRVDHRVSDNHKEKAYRALELTLRDLEGVIPTSDELWSLIKNPRNERDPNQVPRYMLFLYLIDLQPVGVLLAERVASGDEHYHSARELMKQGEVYMCVDRIWVREDMRRKGIASQLVTMARYHFVPGVSLSKMQFVFSHPTGMGREFADAYIKM
ncbi:ESCO1/2 acetyl-transferase domain containing protein [Hyaloscypha variabilis]